MTYEELLMEADEEGVSTREKPLSTYEGRIKGNKIAIKADLTTVQKACALSEELGHYHTNIGDILDLTDVRNRKQERKARLWAYDKQIGLIGIINAFKAHHDTIYDIADYLDVSEDFLQEALECYRQIYGIGTMVDNYLIKFEPNLRIYSYHCID